MKETNLFILLVIAACSSGEVKSPQIVLASRERQFQQCYLESDSFMQKLNLKKTGQVAVTFTVAPSGKVEEEKIVSSDFKDANFHACILEVTRSFQFPATEDSLVRKMTKVLNFKTQPKITE
jgi:TonB family protein